jgi:outer membrane receptor for monomeric catechols
LETMEVEAETLAISEPTELTARLVMAPMVHDVETGVSRSRDTRTSP